MSNIAGPTGSNGTELAWRDEPNRFEIMTWTGHSPKVGEYHATLTVWVVDDESKAIRLERVTVRFPYQGWQDGLVNPAAVVPNRHKRMARKVGRDRFGNERFRKLIL